MRSIDRRRNLHRRPATTRETQGNNTNTCKRDTRTFHSATEVDSFRSGTQKCWTTEVNRGRALRCPVEEKIRKCEVCSTANIFVVDKSIVLQMSFACHREQTQRRAPKFAFARSKEHARNASVEAPKCSAIYLNSRASGADSLEAPTQRALHRCSSRCTAGHPVRS